MSEQTDEAAESVEKPPEAARQAARRPAARPAPSFSAVGRRKCATARVRLVAGDGKILINGRPVETYFPREGLTVQVRHPMELVAMLGQVDVRANVRGGGFTGQAGAVALGVSRALVEMNQEFRGPLGKAGLLTRDARMVERKKVGRRGARRGFQWCKR